MLGIGMQELLIIFVVALIVIGPKRLPELARTLGKGFAEFRKAADDLQETVRMDLQKEKQEEFRKKYPHLVPEEDREETASQPRENDSKTGSNEIPGDGSDVAAVHPEPPPGQAPKQPLDKPSIPVEIEGGDETEDSSRDD